ncbi:NUDIX domain-containing protein [Paucisalibacillus sp. EB02]|uniref:NUDIX domain-containing protein n=1 Tax=Paucisalibacillus sp. EB02 TaxID=1347087 RepID=UPI0018CC37A0
MVGNHFKGNGPYYRPIGGAIEHGVLSTESLVREFKEELGIEINIKSYLSCIEKYFLLMDR